MRCGTTLNSLGFEFWSGWGGELERRGIVEPCVRGAAWPKVWFPAVRSCGLRRLRGGHVLPYCIGRLSYLPCVINGEWDVGVVVDMIVSKVSQIGYRGGFQSRVP